MALTPFSFRMSRTISPSVGDSWTATGRAVTGVRTTIERAATLMLQLGEDAKAVAPPALREAVRQRARRIAALYRD